MKYIILVTIIFFTISNVNAVELGETQITAEDGIEVFQKEKYYLLKNNVEILSDNFNLYAESDIDQWKDSDKTYKDLIGQLQTLLLTLFTLFILVGF